VYGEKMKAFLKMKSWQLFLLLFGAHFLLMAVGMIGGDPSRMFIIIPIGMLIFMAVFMAWFWALGTNINRWVPEDIRPSPRRFRFGLIYASVYMMFFLVFFMLMSTGKVGGSGSVFALIFPFHIFATVCMFYALYFVAKNLVMAERKESVGFNEFVGPFFLIWMYPIGVWFIQPRVNRMYREHESMQQ
jgi:hypothetical protein